MGRIDQLPLARPKLGTWPTTQACALTGNQTGNAVLVCGTMANPLSHNSQGVLNLFCSSVVFLIVLNFLCFLIAH